jgi:hypothetical protein
MSPGKHTNSAFPAGMSQPALRALASIGVTQLEQVANHTKRELLALHGFGPKSITILEPALVHKGLSFKGEARAAK